MWPALAAVTPTHCRGRVQGHIVSGLALGQGMLVRVLQQYQSAQPIPCLARYRSKMDFSNLEGLYTSAHGILKLQQRSNWRVVCDWYVSKLDFAAALAMHKVLHAVPARRDKGHHIVLASAC